MRRRVRGIEQDGAGGSRAGATWSERSTRRRSVGRHAASAETAAPSGMALLPPRCRGSSRAPLALSIVDGEVTRRRRAGGAVAGPGGAAVSVASLPAGAGGTVAAPAGGRWTRGGRGAESRGCGGGAGAPFHIDGTEATGAWSGDGEAPGRVRLPTASGIADRPWPTEEELGDGRSGVSTCGDRWARAPAARRRGGEWAAAAGWRGAGCGLGARSSAGEQRLGALRRAATLASRGIAAGATARRRARLRGPPCDSTSPQGS